MKGAKLKICILMKIAHKDFSIATAIGKLYAFEWTHSKTKKAFWTDMKNIAFDQTRQNEKKIDFRLYVAVP